mgnify:CR=1 FL=1|tara:strand:- start:1336 stop:1758 length:423 start_codon:yes stop_codon:yes gene_type:complete
MDYSTATEFLKAVDYYYGATFPDQDGDGGLNRGVGMTADQHAEWVCGFQEVIDQFKQKLTAYNHNSILTSNEFLKAVEYYFGATFPNEDGDGGLNRGVGMTADQHAKWVWGFQEVIDQFKQKLGDKRALAMLYMASHGYS